MNNHYKFLSSRLVDLVCIYLSILVLAYLIRDLYLINLFLVFIHPLQHPQQAQASISSFDHFSIYFEGNAPNLQLCLRIKNLEISILLKGDQFIFYRQHLLYTLFWELGYSCKSFLLFGILVSVLIYQKIGGSHKLFALNLL